MDFGPARHGKDMGRMSRSAGLKSIRHVRFVPAARKLVFEGLLREIDAAANSSRSDEG